MKSIQLIVLLLFFYPCNAQELDYSKLKYVYSDLVDVFKCDDDQKLRNFCYKLATDEKTLEFMRNNSLCYRGIPCEMDKQGIDIKSIGDEFYPILLRVRNRLKHEGLLDSLTHIDSVEYKWDVEIFINEKINGYHKPVNQIHYSTSMVKYEEALLKADSLGLSIDEMLLNGKKGDVIIVKGTEMSMKLKSRNKIIEYPIGEMVLINNKWNLFTRPNVDYYVTEK